MVISLSNHKNLLQAKLNSLLFHLRSPPSKKLEDASMESVTLTINDDKEDLSIKEKLGVTGLRQHRLARIFERTIVRDLKDLRAENIFLPLRSTIKDMGRTLSHRSLIVQEWVKGSEYTEIARKTNHSVKAVNNYVSKFKQVVALMEEDYDVQTIAFLTKISKRLTEEYIDIKANSVIVPSRKHELETLLKKKLPNQ